MKKIICPVIILFLITVSCNDVVKKTNNIPEVVNETPEVLEENSSWKMSSYSGRYDSDIISRLYNEALEKDEKLNRLNEAITKIRRTQNDSLSEYATFKRINANYYTNAKTYANRIDDSLLQKETLKTITRLESQYDNTMADYVKKQLRIEKKALALNDQEILMKLFVTESMMRNYQQNEKPDIKTLERIIKTYDSLIKATQPYTKLKK